VGLLGAALLLTAMAVGEISMIRGTIWMVFDGTLLIVAFALLRTKRAPPWAVVLGTGSLAAAALTFA